MTYVFPKKGANDYILPKIFSFLRKVSRSLSCSTINHYTSTQLDRIIFSSLVAMHRRTVRRCSRGLRAYIILPCQRQLVFIFFLCSAIYFSMHVVGSKPHTRYDVVLELALLFHPRAATFFSGVPQRLDTGDLGRPTRYCYLESIYHTWDRGTDHRASLVSHPTQLSLIHI